MSRNGSLTGEFSQISRPLCWDHCEKVLEASGAFEPGGKNVTRRHNTKVKENKTKTISSQLSISPQNLSLATKHVIWVPNWHCLADGIGLIVSVPLWVHGINEWLCVATHVVFFFPLIRIYLGFFSPWTLSMQEENEMSLSLSSMNSYYQVSHTYSVIVL